MENRELIRRICREAAEGGDLFASLSAGLPMSDLQSLLMETYAARAQRLTPRDALNNYRSGRFVRPSPADPARLCRIDGAAYALLPPGFSAVEPSPLSPFGCSSAFGAVHQNKVVTTIRNAEVCSDVTNYLALECAVRREQLLRGGLSADCVKLCASQRQVRAQPFSGPNSFAHFRVFALCTAGRDEGNFRFEAKALPEHAVFYLRLLEALAQEGFGIRGVEAETVLYDESCRELELEVREAIRKASGLPVQTLQRTDQHYYQGVGFHIFAMNKNGERLNLADGGCTDWTQKLLGSRRERLFTSGIGTERLACCF